MVKPVIVDAKDHMLGRLASVVAKQLLNGRKVVVVRCDLLCVSGSSELLLWPNFNHLIHISHWLVMRNKIKYHHFLRKRTYTNPKQGPFHWRAPCKMFRRVVSWKFWTLNNNFEYYLTRFYEFLPFILLTNTCIYW